MMRLTGTRRYLIRMAVFLGVVAVLTVLLSAVLQTAFLHNPALNGTILAILVFGCVFSFAQVLRLTPEIDWLEQFGRDQGNSQSSTIVRTSPIRMLAPMAAMLGERKGKLSLSPNSTRSMLDSIGARLDEGRDIARYLIGLLILLGLLGTFWGLIQTVSSVGDVIGRLSMSGGDAVAAFEDLKRGLATPLAAMGTAFSSSLFGLAGSLILGFLDLQAGAAQNRFYNELEEWLSGQTRVSSGSVIGEGEQSVPAYIQALLETTADSLENLQRTIARGEEGRMAATTGLITLTDRLTNLGEQMKAQQTLLTQLGENQIEMRPVMTRLAERLGAPQGDDVARNHLRNIEIYLARLIDEISKSRAETVQELRTEIRLVARTIAAITEDTEIR
jgi:hypothetical protein